MWRQMSVGTGVNTAQRKDRHVGTLPAFVPGEFLAVFLGGEGLIPPPEIHRPL